MLISHPFESMRWKNHLNHFLFQLQSHPVQQDKLPVKWSKLQYQHKKGQCGKEQAHTGRMNIGRVKTKGNRKWLYMLYYTLYWILLLGCTKTHKHRHNLSHNNITCLFWSCDVVTLRPVLGSVATEALSAKIFDNTHLIFCICTHEKSWTLQLGRSQSEVKVKYCVFACLCEKTCHVVILDFR